MPFVVDGFTASTVFNTDCGSALRIEITTLLHTYTTYLNRFAKWPTRERRNSPSRLVGSSIAVTESYSDTLHSPLMRTRTRAAVSSMLSSPRWLHTRLHQARLSRTITARFPRRAPKKSVWPRRRSSTNRCSTHWIGHGTS